MQLDKTLFPDHVQPQLGQRFAEAMRQHAWSAKLEPYYSRLQANDHTITEISSGEPLFSTALWDICYQNMANAELWHYTTMENFAKILEAKEIWLHLLSNRMGEGELVEFAAKFDYMGFLDFDKNGHRNADKLAQDLFYLSLTDQDEPGDMWNFGEVRLRLKIAPVLQRAQLWRMEYSDVRGGWPLGTLKEFAKTHFNRDLLPRGTSRNGAFVLDTYFARESEVRLLVKRFEGTTDLLMRASQGGDAIAIPFGAPNTRASIDLVRVEVESAADLLGAQQKLFDLAPSLNVQCIVCAS
jgi:hypothetical protein